MGVVRARRVVKVVVVECKEVRHNIIVASLDFCSDVIMTSSTTVGWAGGRGGHKGGGGGGWQGGHSGYGNGGHHKQQEKYYQS